MLSCFTCRFLDGLVDEDDGSYTIKSYGYGNEGSKNDINCERRNWMDVQTKG